MEEVEKSKEIIQNSGLPYEFRTTAVKGKHTREVFEEIGEWLKGASRISSRISETKTLLKNTKKRKDFSEYELAEFKLLMENTSKLRDKNVKKLSTP